MRRHVVLLLSASAVLAVAAFAVAPNTGAATPTTAPPTTLPIGTAPTTESSSPPNPDATGTILMVKLPVGNVAAAQRFYGAVFGAKLAVTVGSAHIVTFPGGGPGLVLLKRNPKDKGLTGAFIMKVPDMHASVALALANGAKKQGTFAGSPSNQAATSTDMLDPWGNQVEVLQIG
jgi:predicted enzyme related to lactoylglutathione lyase